MGIVQSQEVPKEFEQSHEVPIVFDPNDNQNLTSPAIRGARTRESRTCEISSFRDLHKSHPASRNILNQEDRRLRFLERQQKAREEDVNSHRDLSDLVIKSNPFYGGKREGRKYKNILMKSEWFHEIPSTLDTEWTCVLCPQGERTLIVASKGLTQSFCKYGFQTAVFNSALPGGSSLTTNYTDLTLLDCIWDSKNQIIHVVDVLAWRNQTFLNCDTDFRFFWIKTQFEAMPELEKAKKNNDYVFKYIQRSSCDKDSLKKLFSQNTYNLDGILFYHRDSHYTSGRTPLVGWLLPWMIPEILGLDAPLNSKPKPDKIKDTAQEHMRNMAICQKLRTKKVKQKILDVEMPMSTPEVNIMDAISSIEMEIQNNEIPQTSTAEENIVDDISLTEME